MRGVVALAAALSLPETLGNGEPFREKNVIVFLTFCVILVTLVVQGLTLPPLIRALGLAGDESARLEEEEARRVVLREVIGQLEEGRANEENGSVGAHNYDDLLDQYRHRLAAFNEDGAEAEHHRHSGGQLAALTRKAAQAERRAIVRLRDEGRISDEVLRTVEYELDLVESKVDSIYGKGQGSGYA
jgi:CPA1 family monovalent cation:H+ antiporter